ncbi:MAG: hypothetical protein ACJ76V_09290 [Thermoleophilaceae bacterium]
MISSYETLAGLAERELELARAERYDELEALASERDVLMASLPAQAPDGAGPALERALVASARVTEVLAAAAALARAELDRVNRGRPAVQAYASGLPRRPQAKLVDQSG